MNAKTVLTLVLLGLPAVTGVAGAQPAVSPDDVPNDDRRGPPVDLPDPVPDFVEGLLGLIDQKLAGALSGHDLGEALSGHDLGEAPSGLLGSENSSANSSARPG